MDINKAYKAKEKIIIQQSEIAKTLASLEFSTQKKSKEEIIIIEQQKADKILEIDNNLKENLKKNSAELKKVQLELLEPVKDSKGFIDIDATKENIERAVEALKRYKTSVLITENNVVNSYNLMIAAAGDDEAKVKELTAVKEATQKNYAAQVKEIEENITKIQENENSLRLKQIQSYMEAVSKQTESVKKTMTGISDYLGTTFSAISDAYKAEMAAIDEEIKQLQNKNIDFTQQYKDQQAVVAAMKEQVAAKENELRLNNLTDEDIKANDEIKILKKKQYEEQAILDTLNRILKEDNTR
ncbi:MAG: hypothetical protein LBN74_00680, partial [Prevotella sp.]|nr:hypothetical protein [Prevotella sp.]